MKLLAAMMALALTFILGLVAGGNLAIAERERRQAQAIAEDDRYPGPDDVRALEQEARRQLQSENEHLKRQLAARSLVVR